MKNVNVLCAMAFAVAGTAASASMAGITAYNDRTVWDAAAGAADYTEDFEGFAADIDFSSSSTSAPNGFTIGHSGAEPFRNMIDVVPLDFVDGNGTNSISGFVDGDGVDMVWIAADSDASAFGFDVSSAAGGEGSFVEVLGAGGAILASVTLTNGIDDFFGWVADGGDVITGFNFHGLGDGTVGGGEGFRLDNFAGVNVPAPAGLALIGLGGLVGVRRRR